MQNYMRTILSGLQNWINKRLHETVPETDQAHMQLVKDKNGATSWEERTHYKEVTTQNVVNVVDAVAVSYEDDSGDGINDTAVFMTPWNVDLVADGLYTVIYNGVEYECVACAIPDDTNDMPDGAVMLGNLSAIGVEGGNPDAPFSMLCIPNASASIINGISAIMFYEDNAETITISIRGIVTTTTYKELEEGYLPESIRNGMEKQIVITINDDGTVTSDTDFATAWAMTSAQLQASITINAATHYIFDTLSQTPTLVSKFENTQAGSINMIRIQHQTFIVDTSNVYGSTQKIINWTSSGLSIDNYNIPGFHTSIFFDGEKKYPILSGNDFAGITAEELKYNLGIDDAIAALGLPTPSTADAGKILRVNSDGKYELVSLPNAEEAAF